ncbi:MAG TPA: SDR family oxidoreductase [Gaiella sp.]|nr:SDR family oxidoreductase [Gaiella sp.]
MGRSLDGRVAVVTGASSEIGATMADALAAEGAAVVATYHDEPDLAQEVVDRVTAEGGTALAVKADLSRVSENRRLVEHAVAELGRLDVFVANAGLTHWAPFLELEEEDWDRVVDLNLKGSTFGAQAAARQMVAQREREPDDPYGGRIVFSTSVTGLVVVPNLAAYAATKAALAHLAGVLAVELGPHRVTVNALGIGATVNERNLGDDPRYAEHWAGVIPTGRVGTPQDVAAALRFLVSPEADLVSGHTLTVDGGWSHVGRVP